MGLVEQRQGRRVYVVVLDTQAQLAFAEARSETPAGLSVLGAANGLAALVKEDAVAAAEGSQWADNMQLLAKGLQLLALLAQLAVHGTRQTAGQAVQLLAQQGQATPWVLGGQASIQAGEQGLALLQVLLLGTAQTHIQVVEALGLLAQAFAGMAQTAGQPVETQALLGQQALHAQEQAAPQVIQAALQIGTVRGQQFGGSRGRWCAHIGDELSDR